MWSASSTPSGATLPRAGGHPRGGPHGEARAPVGLRGARHDADRAQISIVECGGKSNIPVFARTCKACRIPFVVVHDRDAPPGEQPIPAEVVLNRLIASIAGRDRTVVLEPD